MVSEKKCDAECLTLKILCQYILKDEKRIKTEVNLVCTMDKKMISPQIEWCIGKCPGLCTISLKLSHGTQSLPCSNSVYFY